MRRWTALPFLILSGVLVWLAMLAAGLARRIDPAAPSGGGAQSRARKATP